ncbi:MAG: hypothetical protein GX616_00080 [Planctomycetes bacterium]|nr:hypothetical protein [Planctomycetota bacterium]
MKLWIWLLIALVVVPVLMVMVLLFALGRDIAPPNTADLVVERVEVADADNAYTHFAAAAAVLDWPKHLDDKELLVAILDGEKSDPEFVAELLSRNEKVFPLIEQGLACDICQVPEVYRIDDVVAYGYPQEWHQLAQLLLLKSRHQREAGQNAEAIKTCGQLLRLGSLTQGHPECVIQFLVGLVILNKGLDETRQLAASQDLAAGELAILSGHLARVESPEAALVRSFKKEYQIMSNTIDDLRDGKLTQKDLGLPECRLGDLFQPNKTRCIAADFYRKLIENTSKPLAQVESVDIDKIVGHDRDKAAFMPSPNQAGTIFLRLMIPVDEVILQANCHEQGAVSATRLIVACRRYELDHGELPPTLDALVPDYLDAVPVDPFDGKPFRYVRDRAIVYSIGKDLVDAGGSETPAIGWNPDGANEQPWETEDAVFYIHGRPEKPGEESE